MKKLILFFTVGLLISSFCFAQNKIEEIPEIILYAINDDYKSFEEYVKKGGNLLITTDKGMSLQISLAYFSQENLKKACNLLKKKNIDLDIPNSDNFSLLHYLCYSANTEKVKTLLKHKPDINRTSYKLELTPVQMTQYSSYLFYDNQPENPEAIVEQFNIQELLLKKNYYNFQYSNVTYGYYGNLILSLFNAITTVMPEIEPSILFNADLIEETHFYNQQMGTITRNKMEAFLKKLELNPDINEYRDKEEIINALNDCNVSDDYYFIFAQTGNSPIAPFQWGSINGFEDDNIKPETFIIFSTPDPNFNYLEYQVKDISYLITVKISI